MSLKRMKITSDKTIIEERVKGCLLGVAVGDALGAPFEHLWPNHSNLTLDKTEGLIKDFHPGDGFPAGSWTDDTGMTLATCRAFIRMKTSGDSIEKAFRWAFQAWAGSDESRRPGKTVIYAAKYGKPDVNSWANGALMRISPVAIYSYLKSFSLHETATLAYKIAALTHGHPWATFPAVECTMALRSIFLEEEIVPKDLADSGKYCSQVSDGNSTGYSKYLEKRHLQEEATHPTTGLRMWKQVFERCLGLSGGCSWSSLPGFETGILKAVNESFDRDTAGAVAGALLGAYWGYKNIPVKWQKTVWKRDEIINLANQMIET